jgi:hypothetical protein
LTAVSKNNDGIEITLAASENDHLVAEFYAEPRPAPDRYITPEVRCDLVRTGLIAPHAPSSTESAKKSSLRVSS